VAALLIPAEALRNFDRLAQPATGATSASEPVNTRTSMGGSAMKQLPENGLVLG
jgi:hypothetical protein